jgi:DNA-binding XRE family transcriptional regulator
MTTKELAHFIGIPSDQYLALEVDPTNLSSQITLDICKALGIDLDQFWRMRYEGINYFKNRSA